MCQLAPDEEQFLSDLGLLISFSQPLVQALHAAEDIQFDRFLVLASVTALLIEPCLLDQLFKQLLDVTCLLYTSPSPRD